MRYAVLGGNGKRLRPILCVLGAEATGGRAEEVLPTACALECIHAFSLVHDDLPALDNDVTRRGLPACHVQFGEATAILAGDALLARAFDLLAEQALHVSPARVVGVLKVIGAALGVNGMAGGQMADLQAERQNVAAETLDFIHSNKTAALIHASALCGGLLTGADGGDLSTLSAFGNALGRAFQITDDLLSEVGEAASLGKPVLRDRERGKATYPGLYGIEATKSAARKFSRAAVEALGPMGSRGEMLQRVASSFGTMRRDQLDTPGPGLR